MILTTLVAVLSVGPASMAYVVPCPLFPGSQVGGSAGHIIDLNGDGKQDIIYSFSRGSQQGQETASAVFLGVTGGYCISGQVPDGGFYETWGRIVGSCLENAPELIKPCNKSSLLIPPCALNAYYPQTFGSVQHGLLSDINGDGLVDIIYSYSEGVAQSAIATFLQTKNNTFCNLYQQQVLSDQCVPNASSLYPPCA